MSEDRIAKLARRVRWLEHNRRAIRRAIAVVVAVIGFVALPELLGSEWPRIHARLMGIALGVALAFVADIAFATMLALWEVRHDALVRDRGLPRAVLRRGRK